MIAFLLSLLVLLLYAGIAVFIIYILIYFFGKIFGEPIPPRIAQIAYALIGLLFVIWFLQSVLTHTPIPPPWQLGR